ncbi:HesA/MoeB/ThiF family protein [Nocardioides stalactiti]|uniref:HesA/MoeB/ThiF family protein n=1 Tax=Nocardioides stalactiti TaxID=2755356 RepID=UPI0016005BE9|nr:ThiF family adenylyltransferase [Nocardioides stalactiti]
MVTLGHYRQNLVLSGGSLMKVIPLGPRATALVQACDFWTEPRTVAAVEANLRSAGHTEEDVSGAVELLLEPGYLVDPAIDFGTRYARPHLYYSMHGVDPGAVQARLSSSHVVILGCGGIGNFVAPSLATAGVGRLSLVDADRIELSNLTRQFMFTEADVGDSKIAVLADQLRKRHGGAEIDTFSLNIASEADLDQLPACDLIIVSADTPSVLLNWVNRYAHRVATPFLPIAYIEDIATWGPFVIPGATACFDCVVQVAELPTDASDQRDQMARVNARYQAPSNGPTNMVSSGLATLDALRYLGGFGAVQSVDARIGLWLDRTEFEQQRYVRDPSCPTCSPG